jgi:hypothetical protein
MGDRDEILATRLDLARDTLAPGLAGADVDRLAKEASAVWPSLDFAGKALAAAHAALPVPEDPIGRLWHAATVLREYRGDCHVAILTSAGLDGAAANALAVADGRAPANQREMRGWTDDEWAAAYERLRERDWTNESRDITDTGRAARAQIEDATDRVSTTSFDKEAQARVVGVHDELVAAARAIVTSGALPYPNPVGVKAP